MEVRFQRWLHKRLLGWGPQRRKRTRGLLCPRQTNRASCCVVLTQGRESCKSATSDARSVMLRIPLPEDDGFALAKQRIRGALP